MYVYVGASGLAWIALALAVLWAGPGALGVLSAVPLVSTLLQVLGLVMVVQLVSDAYRGKPWPALTWLKAEGKY